MGVKSPNPGIADETTTGSGDAGDFSIGSYPVISACQLDFPVGAG